MGALEDLAKAIIASNSGAGQLIAAEDPYLKFKQAPDAITGLALQAAATGKHKVKDLLPYALVSGLASGGLEAASQNYQGRAKDAYQNVLLSGLGGQTVERPEVLSPGLFNSASEQAQLFRIQNEFGQAQRAQDMQDIANKTAIETGAKLGAEDAFWKATNGLPAPAPSVEGAAQGGEVAPGAAAAVVPDISRLNPNSPQYKVGLEERNRLDKLKKEQTDLDMKKADDLLGLAGRIGSSPEARNLSDVAANWEAMIKVAPDRTQASSIGMITALAKIIDPGAVVREQDFTIIADPGSPARALQGYLDKLKGEGQLTATMKTELMQLGRAHVESRYNQYSGFFDDQASTAAALGLDASKVKKRAKPSLELPTIDDGVPQGFVATGRTTGGKPVFQNQQGQLWTPD